MSFERVSDDEIKRMLAKYRAMKNGSVRNIKKIEELNENLGKKIERNNKKIEKLKVLYDEREDLINRLLEELGRRRVS